VEGLGRDDDGKYFNMNHSELTNSGLDLWLLGHIHVAYPTQNEVNENPGYFMSGTHMPDSWKSTNAGNAWIIEIHEDKKVKAKKFQPSAFNYKVIESDIRSIADIDNFKNQLLNCDKKNTALRLNLTGTLVHNDLSYLEETINEICNEFIHFEENIYIKKRIDLDAINTEFVEGSLPHILLSELLLEDPSALVSPWLLDINTHRNEYLRGTHRAGFALPGPGHAYGRPELLASEWLNVGNEISDMEE
jgi:DNA repair exonuclease SbcCD nuclease subunit